jgi:ArsR family transcriptional regulator
MDGISLRIGELDHLPLRDGEADFICINLVLHHLSRPSAALGEIARVLHPGGLVLITDFDQHLQENMRTSYGDRWLGFSLDDMNTAMERAGLSIVDYRRQPVKKDLALHLILAKKSAPRV